MGLFQTGDFTLASGAKSRWKIDCDGLTADDWAALAAMAVEVLPPFFSVTGVPRGGDPFAAALERYCSSNVSDGLLIAEDVVTTGASIERRRAYCRQHWTAAAFGIRGVCVFARPVWTPGVRGWVRRRFGYDRCPDWVTPLFQMPQRAEGV